MVTLCMVEVLVPLQLLGSVTVVGVVGWWLSENSFLPGKHGGELPVTTMPLGDPLDSYSAKYPVRTHWRLESLNP